MKSTFRGQISAIKGNTRKEVGGTFNSAIAGAQ